MDASNRQCSKNSNKEKFWIKVELFCVERKCRKTIQGKIIEWIEG